MSAQTCLSEGSVCSRQYTQIRCQEMRNRSATLTRCCLFGGPSLSELPSPSASLASFSALFFWPGMSISWTDSSLLVLLSLMSPLLPLLSLASCVRALRALAFGFDFGAAFRFL